MLRKIKFRAWNILNKKMLNWKDIFDLPAWEIFPGTPEQRPFEVMQYTGLKDENKKEIYEGDVIKENGWDDIFYLVVFEDCKFIAKKIGHHNGDIFTKRDKELDGVMWPIVIGNKYRNPELLEGEVNVSN